MHSLFLFAMLAAPAATVPAGVLSGRVTDESGRPLANVRVEVVEVHRHATTDAEGEYRVTDLPEGVYRVSFALIGFRPEVRRVQVGADDVRLEVTLVPSVVEIATLQVTASAVATTSLTSPQPLSIVDAEALRTLQSATLGQTLELQPGIRNFSTGGGIGKPVIRGLSSNRVLVLADGQRLETQQWGDEHGPNVEGGNAERIEIIRGPASVLYGSDALGGVVNVVQAPLPDALGESPFATGSLTAGYGTNGTAPDGRLAVEGASGAVGARGVLYGRTASDTRTPDGELANSGYDVLGGSLATGVRGAWGNASLDYAGRSERVEIHEDPEEEPDFTGYQRIKDDRIRAHLNLPVSGTSRVEVLGGWQRNFRREFEEADVAEFALGLESETWTGDARLHHALGRMGGTIGASFIRNDFARSGEESLVPNSDYSNFGVYGFEQIDAGRWQLSFGLRYDHRNLSVEDEDFGIPAQTRKYNSLTGNLGALLQLGEKVALVANLGRGYRAPSTFELFADGVHEGTVRYERGNPDLDNETSINGDLAVRVQSRTVSAELGGFVNVIDSYIYPDPTGETDPESGFLIYQYAQGDATLYGFEAAAEFHPSDRLHLRGGADYVYGQNRTLDQPLAFVPPLRVTYGVRVELPGSGQVLESGYVDLGGETNAMQTRIDPDDFAPEGYTLFQAGGGVSLGVGRRGMNIDLTVRNLFDTRYASFMSRYKYYALDPGRNVTLRVTTQF